jgi:MbtH protein
MTWNSEETVFVVVVNAQEQYALWPAHRALPAGWHATDQRGDRQACLDFVDRVWTDMRPRSLREALKQDTELQTGG